MRVVLYFLVFSILVLTILSISISFLRNDSLAQGILRQSTSKKKVGAFNSIKYYHMMHGAHSNFFCLLINKIEHTLNQQHCQCLYQFPFCSEKCQWMINRKGHTYFSISWICFHNKTWQLLFMRIISLIKHILCWFFCFRFFFYFCSVSCTHSISLSFYSDNLFLCCFRITLFFCSISLCYLDLVLVIEFFRNFLQVSLYWFEEIESMFLNWFYLCYINIRSIGGQQAEV